MIGPNRDKPVHPECVPPSEPAFPFEGPTEFYGGLTKREYASIQAMKGILSNSRLPSSASEETVGRAAIMYAEELLDLLENMEED